MNRLLNEISQIRVGYYSQETTDSGIPYLQVRQFDDYGDLIAAPDTFVIEDRKSKTQVLKHGDIILASKGSKNFAWCYKNHFGGVIASTSFFVISPDKSLVLPEYLVAIFNHPMTQSYFAQSGLGTNIKSIRKSELEELTVAVLPFQMQEKIVAMYDLHKQEISLTKKVLQKKNELYESVINQIVNNN